MTRTSLGAVRIELIRAKPGKLDIRQAIRANSGIRMHRLLIPAAARGCNHDA
jgi:hypothetical protein